MSSISGDSVKSMLVSLSHPRWTPHAGLPSPPQSHQLAPVDHDGGPRDEAAGVGDQQQQHSVEIALLAETADGDLAFDRRALLAQQIFTVEIGHDPARRDGIDADAPKGELEPERLGELDDAGLR